MKPKSSGPITVLIKEGMVTVAKGEYHDTSHARQSSDGWPHWMLVAFNRIDREHRSRLHDLTTDDSQNEPPDIRTNDDFEV